MAARQGSHPLRRAELAALGIQLPVLPTVCPEPLPAGVDWPRRLELADLDVITTGSLVDDPRSWGTAVGVVSHRPAMALAADADGAAALARAGCRLIATSAVVSQGAYRFFDERCVMGVSGASAEIEDPSVVAARLLAACEVQPASELWVIAGPGLADLPVDLVETKLRALTDGTRQARLWLAKEQFDRDWGPS